MDSVENYLKSYLDTWKEVIQRPSDFYKHMPTTGGYAEPLTFAAISYIIYGLLSAIISLFFSFMGFSFFAFIGTLIMTPIFCIVVLFIAAAIFNFIYNILGGTGNYEGTLRFMSYASAPMVVSWIPFIGLLGGIYALYLYIVGGMNVHKVPMEKSALAILLPTILIFLVFMILAGLAMFSMFR
jgi:hypothetical protein